MVTLKIFNLGFIVGVEIQPDYNLAFSSLDPDKQHKNLTKFATSTGDFIQQHGVDALNKHEDGYENILQLSLLYESSEFVKFLLYFFLKTESMAV